MPPPDFTSWTRTGEGGGDRSAFSSLRGRRVVIYFYPQGPTPGLHQEACGFLISGRAYEQLGSGGLGSARTAPPASEKNSSPSTPAVHLLCGPEPCPVASAYGSYGTEEVYGPGIHGHECAHLRGDPEGKLELGLSLRSQLRNG